MELGTRPWKGSSARWSRATSSSPPPMRWHDHGHEGTDPVVWLAMATGAPPDVPVIARYVNPRTGASPLPIMGCEAQWLRPGGLTRAQRRTGSGIFHVVEGRGESRIGDATFEWARGDTFVAPPWHWLSHRNASATAPACLFHLNDEPALRALGLRQEEARA